MHVHTTQDLKRQLKELQLRLEFAYKREDEAAQMKEQPLTYAKEFMALSDRDMEKFMDYFEKVDVDRKGYITTDEFFNYLKVRRHDTIRQPVACSHRSRPLRPLSGCYLVLSQQSPSQTTGG